MRLGRNDLVPALHRLVEQVRQLPAQILVLQESVSYLVLMVSSVFSASLPHIFVGVAASDPAMLPILFNVNELRE
jgi:hypothetical protein